MANRYYLKPSNMKAGTAMILLNGLLLMCSISALCSTSSIFDFIVINRMYYTVPDQKILLEPEISCWFYTTALFTLILSLLHYFYEGAPKILRDRVTKYPEISSLMHSICLSIACISSAYCCFVSGQTARELSQYAHHSAPRQFQMASCWYYNRFKGCFLFFGLNSLITMFVLCFLYLGIECRYREFAQLPQQPKKEVMRTTLFP